MLLLSKSMGKPQSHMIVVFFFMVESTLDGLHNQGYAVIFDNSIFYWPCVTDKLLNNSLHSVFSVQNKSV